MCVLVLSSSFGGAVTVAVVVAHADANERSYSSSNGGRSDVYPYLSADADWSHLRAVVGPHAGTIAHTFDKSDLIANDKLSYDAGAIRCYNYHSVVDAVT
jgi:hypothetical protein